MVSIRRAPALLALTFAMACGDGPTDPLGGTVSLTATLGDGVFVLPGELVTLEATVRREPDGAPFPGAAVAWTVALGQADVLGGGADVSDSTGAVTRVVRVGMSPGAVEVTARLRDDPAVSATFGLTVASIPVLESVTPLTVTPGGLVRLVGGGFSPDPAQNVVLFSGIRGRVTAAATDALTVEVPDCMGPGAAAVEVRFGALTSQAMDVAIEGEGRLTTLGVGTTLDVDEPTAPGCVRLGHAPASEYLVLAASTSTVGAARYGYTLTGRSWLSSSSPATGRGSITGPLRPRWSSRHAEDAEELWHAELRRVEREALDDRSTARSMSAVEPAGRVPVEGEERSFQVLNRERSYDEVVAVARRVTEHAVLYVDVTSPAGGLQDSDFSALGRAFDDLIHPAVTSGFGEPSDLDGNERVAILFTPTVNRLTPRGQDGFVAGFFFGVDLLPEREGSNAGEVFYALVPDPLGVHSDPHTVEELLDVTGPVLAHEFQHMVHFNERVLARGAPTADAVWLSEGLAQMAEELVARRLESLGELDEAALYRRGNVRRARRYLGDPSGVSLLIGTGQGSLSERGAAWLFVLYLTSQFGGEVPKGLTQTTTTGASNVERATARPFGDLMMDWWAALYVEGAGVVGDVPPAYSFPGVDFSWLLSGASPAARRLGTTGFRIDDDLWSASVAYYILEPSPGASTAMRMGGSAQGGGPPGGRFRLRVVRLPTGP